jgi:hypothetical protein
MTFIPHRLAAPFAGRAFDRIERQSGKCMIHRRDPEITEKTEKAMIPKRAINSFLMRSATAEQV